MYQIAWFKPSADYRSKFGDLPESELIELLSINTITDETKITSNTFSLESFV